MSLPREGTPEFQKCINAIEDLEPDQLNEFAKKIGYSSSSSFITMMNRRGYKRGDRKTEIPALEQLESFTEKQRLQTEVNHYKKLYREAAEKIGLQQSIVESIKEVASLVPPIKIPHVDYRDLRAFSGGNETEVLQLSDLHGGEVVRSEETMGMAQYDMMIMNRRLGHMFKTFMKLVELRRSALTIPDLLIAEEGDMLSGDIHDDLIRTNVSHMMTLAVRVAFMLSQGIGMLAPHFEHIEVDCVVGNHPRLWKKPNAKQHYINWDYMVYQWQAVFCRSMKNVKFVIPQSPFMLTKAQNTRLLLMHGDGIKSWMGIPWYGIDRTIYRMRELLQGNDQFFDSVLLGHFHNRAELTHVTGPILINGSVKGGDEYSIGSLQTISKASQNMLFYHSEHGYLGGYPIYLEEADNREEDALKDFLPDTWAELEYEMVKENGTKGGLDG